MFVLTPITFLNVPIDLQRLKRISSALQLDDIACLSMLVTLGMDKADQGIAPIASTNGDESQEISNLDDAIKDFIEGPGSGEAFRDLMENNPKEALKMAMSHLPANQAESEKDLTEDEYNVLRRRLEAHKYEDFVKIISAHNAAVPAEYRVSMESLRAFSLPSPPSAL